MDQTLQFSGVAPMDNLKAKIRTEFCELKVADLAKHEIVAALNPINLPSPWRFSPSFIEMNSHATRGNVHD